MNKFKGLETVRVKEIKFITNKCKQALKNSIDSGSLFSQNLIS